MLNQSKLKDLQVGDELAHLVRVGNFQFVEKGKNAWMELTIADSTQKLYAKKWKSSPEEVDKYKEAKHLFVTGKVQEYNNKLSVILNTLVYPADDVSEEDYKSLELSKDKSDISSSDTSNVTDAFSPITKSEIDFETRKNSQKRLKEHVKDEQADLILRISVVESKEARNGRNYLEFKMGDNSSDLIGKRWDTDSKYVENFKDIKAVRVKGRIDLYNGKLQIIISEVHPITDATDEDVKDLYVSSPYDLTFLKKGIWNHIKSMQNPFIKQLAQLALQQPIIKERFGTWVAAVSMHHNYRGGLATHVYRLMEIADRLVDVFNEDVKYPGQQVVINKDIVMFLCLMHDMFKISDYSESGEMDNNGRLVPHLPKGAIFSERLMDQIPEFPEELRVQISHGLLSHHGTLEFGSPVTPMTPEAILFHFIDFLTAKLDPVIEALSALPEGERWTESLKSIDRNPAYIGGTLFSAQQEK